MKGVSYNNLLWLLTTADNLLDRLILFMGQVAQSSKNTHPSQDASDSIRQGYDQSVVHDAVIERIVTGEGH